MRKCLILVSLVTAAMAQTPQTKGNIEVLMYHQPAGTMLTGLGPGPSTDLTWVSARDLTGTATHLDITLTCKGMLPETRRVRVPHTTVVFPRSRTIPCSVSVEARVVEEFEVPQE